MTPAEFALTIDELTALPHEIVNETSKLLHIVGCARCCSEPEHVAAVADRLSGVADRMRLRMLPPAPAPEDDTEE